MEKDKKHELFKLTWPLFIELFLRLLMGNVNVFMLSNYSDNAVGAVGVSKLMKQTWKSIKYLYEMCLLCYNLIQMNKRR